MKTYCSIILLIVTLSRAAYSSGYQTNPYDSVIRSDTSIQKLKSQIREILNDTALAPCLIGIKIIELENGSVLFAENNNKLFHPASNMKLLTTSTAINLLDKHFLLRTKITTNGKVSKGVLRGNLYIKGIGDPLLDTDDLDTIASVIRNQGIRRIEGNLIGDVGYFDTLHWGAGWMWDDEPDSYAAFISPMTINSNSVEISVAPGYKLNSRVKVTSKPVTKYIKLINNGITSNDTTIPTLTVTRRHGVNTFLIDGRLSPLDTTETFSLSVLKPEFYFLTLLKEKLTQIGIKIKGRLKLDTVKGNSTLAEIVHPIDSIIYRINKISDNLAAENLLKIIAAETQNPPGTSLNGLTIVKEYLYGISIDTSKLILADGSGMSFYNVVSPDMLIQILQKQYVQKENFQRFLESLPIGGVDGTLKNRMKQTRTEGNVRAKTGTLTGVSALSGYVKTADDKLLAFSILCNHHPAQISVLRDMQDKIMEILSNFQFAPR